MDVKELLPLAALPSSLRVLDLSGSAVIHVTNLPTSLRWLRLTLFELEVGALMADLQHLSANTKVVWG